MFFNDFQNGWDAYVNKDYKKAADIWFPLAVQGDSKAQFFLGFIQNLYLIQLIVDWILVFFVISIGQNNDLKSRINISLKCPPRHTNWKHR